MITASERLVRIPATICGAAAGQHEPPDPLAPRDAVRARGLEQRRVDAAHAVDRVQQDREQAEEGDERRPSARCRSSGAGRSRSAAAPAAASRASTRCAASPRAAPSARGRSGCRARCRRRRAMPKPSAMRSRLGTTCVPNCENSHRSWNSTRIVDSRGNFGTCACTVQSCHASEDRDRHRDLGGDLRGAVSALTRPPARCDGMPAQRAPLERREDEVDRDAEEAGRERERVQLLLEAVRRGEVDAPARGPACP